MSANPTLKWDAPTARPLALHYAAKGFKGVRLRVIALIILMGIFILPSGAARTDSELITMALKFAKNSKDGIDPKDLFYKHCRERALTFSTLPPPIGKSENNLNEVQIERKEPVIITFFHYGSMYDGVNCKISVEFNQKDNALKVSTERLNESR